MKIKQQQQQQPLISSKKCYSTRSDCVKEHAVLAVASKTKAVLHVRKKKKEAKISISGCREGQ